MADATSTATPKDRVPDSPETFAASVEHAAGRLFGRSELYGRLAEAMRRLEADCRRLRERGQNRIPALVLVGGVGEGKSWLANCFLRDSEDSQSLRKEIAAGKEVLTWFGPERPFGLDDSAEQFLQTPRRQMIDLGCSYIVGDAPGFTDHSAARERLAQLATTSAPIKILVTSVNELRDGRTEEFVRHMNGSLILPVVRFEAASEQAVEPDEETRRDVEKRMAGWQQAADSAEFLPACFMPTQRLLGTTETVRLMQSRLVEALTPPLLRNERLGQSVERQVEERVKLARREVAGLLNEFRQRVVSHVDGLDDSISHLPECLREELLGDDAMLRVGICQRLRADWISRTPTVCFPYRSLLGLLALTAGAWDRLMLSFIGSLPSLAMTVFQSVRNVRDAMGAIRKIREGVTQRVQGRIEDEVLPQIQNLQTALASTLPESQAASIEKMEAAEGFVRIHGLDRMEAESRRIIAGVVDRRRASTLTVWLFGTIATICFLYLISGPVYAIYRTYLQSHWGAISGGATAWSDFPTPSASMLFSSILLSVLPTFLIALIGIWWSCNAKRVRRAMDKIKTDHENEIQRRTSTGSLRVVLSDPVIDSARFLLDLAARRG